MTIDVSKFVAVPMPVYKNMLNALDESGKWYLIKCVYEHVSNSDKFKSNFDDIVIIYLDYITKTKKTEFKKIRKILKSKNYFELMRRNVDMHYNFAIFLKFFI